MSVYTVYIGWVGVLLALSDFSLHIKLNNWFSFAATLMDASVNLVLFCQGRGR